jgi:hypothetical protein
MMTPRKVLIATPSLDGRVEAEYAVALAETVRLGVQRGIGIHPLIVCRESLLPNVRNDLMSAVRKFDMSDIIWIDSDQEWNPEWVFRLLSHPVDVVGAPVIKRSEQEAYNVRSIGGSPQIPVDPATGLLVIDAVGTGFLRMSRKAVDALWDASVPYTVSGRENEPLRWIFDVRPVDGLLISEDTLVCFKLRDLGFKIYLDPTMTCSHIGPKKWSGDFAKWLQGLQMQTAA